MEKKKNIKRLVLIIRYHLEIRNYANVFKRDKDY